MKRKVILQYLANFMPYVFSIYLMILGLSWIFLHIYMRFFIERPSYTLEEFKAYISTKHYIIFIGFIVFNLVLILYNLIVLRRQRPQNNALVIVIIKKLVFLIEFIYWKPLDYIHDKVAPHIPMSGRFFLYVEKIWSKKDNVYFYIAIFLFEILPRLLISLVFLIDIVIFGQIKLFLHMVSLFFVTIIWHVFLKLYANFGKRNLPIIEEYFSVIRGIGDPILDADGNVSSYSAYEFFVKPEYEDVINVEEEAKLLLQLEAMPRFVEQIKRDTGKVMPYITIMTSLVYVVGGIYRLIFFFI